MNPAARVVPDVATFAVDDGFWYSIPDHLAPDLHIGSIVRVPLSGRRVRGWVVEIVDGREGKLKDIAGVSGTQPVFDPELLETHLWAARHYVAPVSTLLSRASPPNLPRRLPAPVDPPEVEGAGSGLAKVVALTSRGGRSPVVAVVGNWRRSAWLTDLGPAFGAGTSVLIIAASAAEVSRLGVDAAGKWGDLVTTAGGDDDRSDTDAWEAAQSPPRLVIGTPKTASWKIGRLGVAIVLEEGRRAMKDRQTPTIHVREMMRTRSRLEGFNLAFYGPTPSVELLSAGAEVVHEGNRAWPLVEIIDRADDPPGSGFLSERTVNALVAARKAGRRSFVFTHRRLGFASMRCQRCRALRTCSKCGRRLGRTEECPRCGAVAGPCPRCGNVSFEEMGTIPERLVVEIDRRVGPGAAAIHPGDALVTVGTERDLAGLDPVSLAVAADGDGLLMGIGYRTTEEALRQLARLALVVAEGRGNRLMLQTIRPDSLLMSTMRRGDPIPYLERVLVERAREGSPPAAEMLTVEIRGDVPHSAANDLAGLTSAVIMGPMAITDGMRWLLTGQLGQARLELRRLVSRWRDQGATVRVDADPIDV